MIKYAVFDLDGTLLVNYNNPFILDKTSEQAIELLKNNNIEFVIATGRPREFAEKIANKYYCKNMIICAQNGAEIIDRGNRIISYALSCDETKTIVDIIRSVGEYCYIQLNNQNGEKAVDVKKQDLYREFVLKYGTESKITTGIDEYLKESDIFMKVVVVYKNSEMAQKNRITIEEKLNHNYRVSINTDVFVEINNIKASKANVIDYLHNQYGVDYDEVAVFGDSENDVPIMEMVKYSFCMRTASKEIQDKCYMVVDDVLIGVKKLIKTSNHQREGKKEI